MLFVSQARGDAEPGSDIDVLVVLRGEVSPCEEIGRTVEDVADVSLHHNEVVCCVFVSAEQFERERSPLLLNIRREGVPIWCQSKRTCFVRHMTAWLRQRFWTPRVITVLQPLPLPDQGHSR
jgi:Nucleotidyltransferase domain